MPLCSRARVALAGSFGPQATKQECFVLLSWGPPLATVASLGCEFHGYHCRFDMLGKCCSNHVVQQRPADSDVVPRRMPVL